MGSSSSCFVAFLGCSVALPAAAQTAAPTSELDAPTNEPDARESKPDDVQVIVPRKVDPEGETPVGAFEQAPTAPAEGTGHVVPTTGWTEEEPDVVRPFSVGGVTAQAGPDTWFKFYGFVQTRYVSGQHESETEGKLSGGGFSLARARLFFYGHLTDWLRVLVRVGATADGTARFEQAFADLRYGAFTLRLGQFYLPAFQEQSLSPVALQPLNFSAVGAVFDGGQTQGAKVTWAIKSTRLHLFVTDGFRTGFSEVGSPKAADLAVSLRAETLVGGGDYEQLDTGSSFRGERPTLLLGAGVHYQSGGALLENAVQMASSNIDATFEWNGASLHCSAAIMDTANIEGTRAFNGGLVVQGGFMVLPWAELYGRYEALLTTATDLSEQSVFRGATAGINYYVRPERGLRATLDFVYYFDKTLGTVISPDPNAGLFESSGPQWTTRAQFNVLF